MHPDFYDTDLGDGVRLFSALFEQGCRVQLEHDLAEQLMLALGHMNDFDDSGLAEYEAEFEGKVWFAPGVVWAHASCSKGRHVAVLPLPLGEPPIGRMPVTVAGATREIVFVAGESQHVDFFRTVIASENADEEKFENVLSAQVGAQTSDENGSTKRHRQSRLDRTRRHRGVNKVFWWHVKLRPHVDRIYFRYEPQHGCIVVGLFKDHCVLPN